MMRRYIFSLVAPLLSVFTAAADPSTAEAVLARMRSRQETLTTLRASLRQVKSYPQLGIEDPPESGRLLLDRRGGDSRVRIDIVAPERRTMTLKNGRYVLYQPRIRQALEGTLNGAGSRGAFSGVLTGSASAMDELSSSYQVSSAGIEALGDRSVHHLRFTARAGSAVYCQEIDLFVDRLLDLPVRQTCREANDAVVSFTLTDVEVDVPLDQGDFEIVLPPGVERVKGGP